MDFSACKGQALVELVLTVMAILVIGLFFAKHVTTMERETPQYRFAK